MERLTIRNSDGSVSQPTHSTFEKVFNRLAEYEDTGLPPEICREYKTFEDEIVSKGVTIKRIVELMNAEAEGRLVVLPCKVGDAVYRVKHNQPGCEWCLGRLHGKCADCEKYDSRYAEIVKGAFSYDMIGRLNKTVFLTREEAEASLKGKTDKFLRSKENEG